LVSALLAERSLPAHLVGLWREGRFDLITSSEQLDELMRVTRYPKIRQRLEPALAGRLINELRDLTVLVEKLPAVTVCPDPYDNYLLAMAAVGAADFLVTGDKQGLLSIKLHEGTRIITVRDFLTMHRRLPRTTIFRHRASLPPGRPGRDPHCVAPRAPSRHAAATAPHRNLHHQDPRA